MVKKFPPPLRVAGLRISTGDLGLNGRFHIRCMHPMRACVGIRKIGPKKQMPRYATISLTGRAEIMRRPAGGRQKGTKSTLRRPTVRETAPGGSLTEFSVFGNRLITPGAAQLGLTGHPVVVKNARARGRKAVVIGNKEQLRFQTLVLITALEKAVDYQPRPQSNDPAPELYRDLALEKPANLRVFKALLAELRRLNALLEKAIVKSTQVKSTQKPVVEVRKHLNTFLGSFAKSAGTGAGWLFIGVAATILYNTGYFDPSILVPSGPKSRVKR
jgi:hypothetical protein